MSNFSMFSMSRRGKHYDKREKKLFEPAVERGKIETKYFIYEVLSAILACLACPEEANTMTKQKKKFFEWTLERGKIETESFIYEVLSAISIYELTLTPGESLGMQVHVSLLQGFARSL